MAKRKHTDYTVHLKAEILKRHFDDNEKVTTLSKKYGIPQNTISGWKSQKDKIFTELSRSIQPQRKRIRLSRYPDVEKALLVWIKDMRSRDTPPPLDSQMILEKAERYAC